jgi:alcohol dehydrogenase class IV
MPAVLAANRAAIEGRIDRLAAFLGIGGGFDGFMDFVLSLRAELGVPAGLIAFGVPETSFEAIAEMAPDDPTAGGNPIKLTRELAREMVEAAR